MRIHKYILIAILLTFVASWFSCTDSEPARKTADLESAAETIRTLKKKLTDQKNMTAGCAHEKTYLEEQVKELRKTVQKYESIMINDQELKRRTAQLIRIQQSVTEFNAEKDNLPKVILSKIDKNTVFIKVDDDARLTQRMGTYGAAEYMKDVYTAITSVDGIDCVYFDIEEGVHAYPMKYCR